MRTVAVRLLTAGMVLVVLAGCGSSPGDPRQSSEGPVLTIGAIPDQDPQLLQRMHGLLSDYLADRLGVEVEYAPVTDYTAAVTTFARGDLQLVFFGGLSGVQARAQVPGAVAVAQRDIDAKFHTVFVASADTQLPEINDVPGLRALAGHSLTFGSESSTSGRLMPQYFLTQAGVTADDLKGKPGFSGSHDATAKLVEAGTYDIGALNAAVWDERVQTNKIDTSTVREIFRTPPYPDYHWLARPDLDTRFGTGFTNKLTHVVLGIDGSDKTEQDILDLFSAEKFIGTSAEAYQPIADAAQKLGLLRTP